MGKIVRQVVTGTIFMISLWGCHTGATEKSASAVMLKYLFVSNDGLLGLYGDGTVRRCLRCNESQSNIKIMTISKPSGTYNDSKVAVTLSDGTVMPLYDDEQISTGWRIISYQKVASPRMVTRYQPCTGNTIKNQTIDLKETALVIIMPERKRFANEDSEEAQDYFTAMDDWSYYVSETTQRYNALGIPTVNSEKSTLSFLLGKSECMSFDVKKWQPGILFENSWGAFLYREGRLPIAVDITNDDVTEAKKYLRDGF